MKLELPEVCDRESAVRFVRWCVETLGLAYHPDTSFADYVSDDGTATFGPEDAARLDILADLAFEFCDPYEVGFGEFRKQYEPPSSGPQIP